MSPKEKWTIGVRVIFAVALTLMLGWELIQPNENRFRSYIRIILWAILLFSQISFLVGKFKNSGNDNNENKA